MVIFLLNLFDITGAHTVKHCPLCTKHFNFSRTTKEKEWNVEIYPPQVSWVPWSQHKGEGRLGSSLSGQSMCLFTHKMKVPAPFQSRIYCTFICNCYILDICSIVLQVHMYISFIYMDIGGSVVNISTSIMGELLLCLLKTLFGLLLPLLKFSTLGALLALWITFILQRETSVPVSKQF